MAIAYFQAAGATQLLFATAWSAGARSIPQPPPSEPDTSLPMRVQPAKPPEPKLSEKPAAPAIDYLRVPPCSGLEATIITQSEQEPIWSRASVRRLGERSSVSVRVGDTLNERRVAFIGYNALQWSPAIWFSDKSDQVCQTLLRNGGSVALSDEVVPDTPRAARTTANSEFAGKIEQRSATEFSIDRAFVDRVLAEPLRFFGRLRITPDGSGKLGPTLFGARAGSLPALLGLQDGDRLQSINGYDLSRPESALEAYAKLRASDKLTLRIQRGEHSLLLDYSIR